MTRSVKYGSDHRDRIPDHIEIDPNAYEISFHVLRDPVHIPFWYINRMRVQFIQDIVHRYIYYAIGIYIVHIFIINVVDEPV